MACHASANRVAATMPPTPGNDRRTATSVGPSEASGRQQSVYRLGVERIDGLLERLAIERGSHDKRLAVFRQYCDVTDDPVSQQIVSQELVSLCVSVLLHQVRFQKFLHNERRGRA